MSQPKIVKDQIEVEGLYKFDGEFGWDDLIGTISSARSAGATAPTWDVMLGGINAALFANNALREVWLTYHVSHTYAPGTVMLPHIHWTSAGTSTGTVRWGIEYTISKGYAQQQFHAPTTIYLEQAFTGVPYTHMIIQCSPAQAIPADRLEPDSLICLRLFRDGAHANDTNTNDVFGFQCDLHFQRGAISTKNDEFPFS